MYFVIPVEEIKVDNNSKAVLNMSVDNRSTVWQQNVVGAVLVVKDVELNPRNKNVP